MTFFRWIFYVMAKPQETENPHYARMSAKRERGECMSLEDINEIVVPLLIERGQEIMMLRREITRAEIRTYVLYFIMGLAVAIGAFYGQRVISQTQDLAETTRQLAVSNRQGIFVGCTVTANVVVRSGAPVSRQNGGPSGRPTPPSAQQRLSALRVKTIHSLMAPAVRAEESKLLGEIARAGGLEVPNCKKIAEHPESVKAYTPNPTRTTP